MAGSSTLQEFLVRLGFNVDEAGLKKFTNTLVTTSKTVVGIAAALQGAQVALTAFTEKVASELENLFYSSQRAGTTIQNLQALQFGFGQAGQGASDAAAMMERLRMALRMNPGNASILKVWGVQLNDLKTGKLKDTTQLFESFISRMDKLSNHGQNLAVVSQIASTFGIGSDELLKAILGQQARLEAEAKYLDLTKKLGYNSNDFGRTSVSFMNQFRELGAVIAIIFEKIGTAIMPSLTQTMKTLENFIIAHKDEIQNFAKDIAAGIGAAVTDIKDTIPYIDELIKKTLGWKKALDLAADVIVYRIFGPLGLALYAIEKLYNFSQHWKEDPESFSHKDDPKSAPDYPVTDLLTLFIYKLVDGIKKLFSTDGTTPKLESGPGFDPKMIHQAAFRSGAAGGGSGGWNVPEPSGYGTIAERHNNPGNLRWAPGVGSSRGFAVFADAMQGFMALGHQLQLYGARGIDTVSKIIGKWAPPSENNTGAYIAQVAKALGVDPNAHLNLGDAGVLRQIMRSIAHVESGKDPWNDELIGEAARRTLGQSHGSGATVSPTINQNNHYNIQTDDPGATGRQVAAHQRSSNADIVRNLRYAVQYS